MCVILAKEPDLRVAWVYELIRLCPQVNDRQLLAGHVDITVIVAVTSWSRKANLYLFHRGGSSEIQSRAHDLLQPPAKWLGEMLRQWPQRALYGDDADSSIVRIEVGTERLRAHPYEINFEDQRTASVWPEPRSKKQRSIADRYGGDVPYTAIRISGFEAGKDSVIALSFRAAPQTIQTAPDELFYPVMGPFRFRKSAREQILAAETEDEVSRNFGPALWREEHPVTDVAVVGMPQGVRYHPIGGTQLLKKVFPSTWMDGHGSNSEPPTTLSATTYAFSPEPGPEGLDFEFWMAARLKEVRPAFVRWLDAAAEALRDARAGAVLRYLAKRGPTTADALIEDLAEEDLERVLQNLLVAGLVARTKGLTLNITPAGARAAKPLMSEGPSSSEKQD